MGNPANAGAANGNSQKLTKNQKRRLRKKERKKELKQQEPVVKQEPKVKQESAATEDDKIEVEYVGMEPELQDNPLFSEFEDIFKKFASPEELTGANGGVEEGAEESEGVKKETPEEDEEGEEDKENEQQESKLSKRQMKKLNRLTVGELKQLVKNPDVVESVDVTAADPKLLCHLKAYRNTVPVPRHWSFKRRYLQGKRGIERPPFQLPGELIAHYNCARSGFTDGALLL